MAGPLRLETCRRASTKRRKRPGLQPMAAPPVARLCLRGIFLTLELRDKGAALGPEDKTFSTRYSAVDIISTLVVIDAHVMPGLEPGIQTPAFGVLMAGSSPAMTNGRRAEKHEQDDYYRENSV
jgi:hypothetical protein